MCRAMRLDIENLGQLSHRPRSKTSTRSKLVEQMIVPQKGKVLFLCVNVLRVISDLNSI